MGFRQHGGLEVVHETAQVRQVLRHTVGQHIVAVGVVAKQPRLLGAQFDDTADDLVVVVLIAAVADAAISAVHLLAQVAAVAVGHEGDVRRSCEGEEPAVEPFGGGFIAGGGTHRLRQAGKVGLVGEVQRPLVEVGQGILAETQFQFAQLLLVVSIALLFLALQRHSVPHKPLEGVVKQRPLFGRETCVGRIFNFQF